MDAPFLAAMQMRYISYRSPYFGLQRNQLINFYSSKRYIGDFLQIVSK